MQKYRFRWHWNINAKNVISRTMPCVCRINTKIQNSGKIRIIETTIEITLKTNLSLLFSVFNTKEFWKLTEAINVLLPAALIQPGKKTSILIMLEKMSFFLQFVQEETKQKNSPWGRCCFHYIYCIAISHPSQHPIFLVGFTQSAVAD